MKKKRKSKKICKVTYKQLLTQHIKILKHLEYNSGLFAASKKNVNTGYDKAWLRDNFYECLPFVVLEDWNTVKKTYRAILKILEKHEYKIEWAIKEKPDATYKYIHARYHPETFDEFWDEWGNKQNDAVGAVLFQICDLELKGVKILKTKKDRKLIQKLIDYLQTIQYWHDPDSGMWEEDEEIHASSVGACLAALKKAKKLQYFKVSNEIIRKGTESLHKMLPRESQRKYVDLALLSLIYPYNIVNNDERAAILKNVEYHLERKRGVIRYKNDHYYNKNPDGYSEEAEWTMGLTWIAIIYEQMKNQKKAKEYLERAKRTISAQGTIPELYFSNSPTHNENDPLGWSEALFIIAVYSMNEKHKAKQKKNKKKKR